MLRIAERQALTWSALAPVLLAVLLLPACPDPTPGIFIRVQAARLGPDAGQDDESVEYQQVKLLGFAAICVDTGRAFTHDALVAGTQFNKVGQTSILLEPPRLCRYDVWVRAMGDDTDDPNDPNSVMGTGVVQDIQYSAADHADERTRIETDVYLRRLREKTCYEVAACMIICKNAGPCEDKNLKECEAGKSAAATALYEPFEACAKNAAKCGSHCDTSDANPNWEKCYSCLTQGPCLNEWKACRTDHP